MLRYWIISAILLTRVITGLTQPAEFPAFRVISPPEGFTYSAVITITEDPFGLIWFGTQHGLYFYDTENIRKYLHKSNDPNSPAGNHIRHLFCDSSGKMWISTPTGLCYYDFRKERFVQCRYTDENGQPASQSIIRVFEDITQQLWVIDQRGLALADTVKRTVTYKTPAGFPLISYASLANDGTLWLGTQNGSIYSGKFPYSEINLFGRFRQNPVISILPVDNELWVSYDWNGVDKFDLSGELLAYYSDEGDVTGIISSSRVRDIYRDPSGRIWLATYKGLTILENDNIYNYNEENFKGINHNSIYKFFEDSHNGLWIGTWSGGLYYRNPHDNTFIHIKDNIHPGLNTNVVSSFTEDTEGNILVGTESGLLFSFNPAGNTYTGSSVRDNKGIVNNIKSLYNDSKGNIWMGTFGSGVYLKTSENKDFTGMPILPVNRVSVYAFAEDRNGIWIGSFITGLFYYDFSSRETVRYLQITGDSSSISSPLIRALLLDRKGNLWIGTMNGLNLKIQGSDKFIRYVYSSYPEQNSITNNEVFSLHEDRYGSIWIGTGGGGLNKYNPETGLFTSYSLEHGLAGLEIYGILEDNDGNLWISSENGISYFNVLTGSFRNFTREDGLQGNQFNPGACYRTKNGEILFGGSNGFNYFLPSQIRTNPLPPATIITALNINNEEIFPDDKDSPLQESLRYTKKLILSSSQNSLTISFVAANYLLPSKNKFRYRLVNYYNDWIEAGTESKATFTKIPPGEYIFEVNAQNNDGVWNQEPTRLTIRVKLPVFLQWYAILGYLVFLLVSTLFISKEIKNRQQLKRQVLQERILRDNMEKLNQVKLQFFTNVSHEFRSPLTLILSPANQLIQKYSNDPDTHYLLKVLKRNTIRLQNLINQIIDLRKIDLKRIDTHRKRINIVKLCYHILDCFSLDASDRKIDLGVDTGFTELYLFTDPDKLDKIIFNLLSNAMKFTPDGGTVKINIELQPDDATYAQYSEVMGKKTEGSVLKITVTDTGTGMEPEEITNFFERFVQGKGNEFTGTGIGLHMVREYTLLLGGYLGISSQADKGTSISVCFPYNPEDVTDLSHVVQDEYENELLDLQPVNSSVEDTPAGSATILLVEDDAEMRSYLVNLLKKHFRLITAGNGQQGFEKALISRPDVILTDLIMPLADGLEMNRMLKENPATMYIPLIILTGQTEPGKEIDSLRAGADVFLTKPFHDELLITHIQNQLARRKSYSITENDMIDKKLPDEAMSPDQYTMNKAVKIIESNLQNPSFEVDILASELNMSRTTLYRKMKTLTGQSATEFIRNTRLKKAIEMIEKEKLSIEEVGIAVGFNSHSYFSHCFRQYFGKTPSEFITELKNRKNNEIAT